MLPRVNKYITIGAMCIMALFVFGFSGTSKISPRLQQKLDNAVATTFEVEDFTLTPIVVDASLADKGLVTLGDENLFKIESGGEHLGYVYLGQAPSKKEIFDYVVLFEPNLTLKKSKVLIYREDHGRQIGSQRWLKQFIGLQPGSQVVYGKDVDAISGATISAESMTTAVNQVLATMDMLHTENVI